MPSNLLSTNDVQPRGAAPSVPTEGNTYVRGAIMKGRAAFPIRAGEDNVQLAFGLALRVGR